MKNSKKTSRAPHGLAIGRIMGDTMNMEPLSAAASACEGCVKTTGFQSDIRKSAIPKKTGGFSIRKVVMTYFSYMKRVLSMDKAVYGEMANAGLSMRYCMINITVLGILYGAASIHFSKNLLTMTPEATLAFNPWMILFVGIGVTYLMHGASALFIWVFCKGIGGCPHFMPPYLNLGIVGVALWPLAPAVAAVQVVQPGLFLQGYILMTVIFGAAVGYVAVHQASGLSNLKMTISTIFTVIWVACFLYLWL